MSAKQIFKSVEKSALDYLAECGSLSRRSNFVWSQIDTLLFRVEFKRSRFNDAFLDWIDDRGVRSGRDRYAMNIALAMAKSGDLATSQKYFLRSEGDPALVKQIASNHGVQLK